jgi:transposase
MNMLPSSPLVTSSPSAGAESSAVSPVSVGIDVSKARLDVALYPSGDHFAVTNDAAGHDELVTRLVLLPPVAIVLEASGGYERDALSALLTAGLPVQRVNPYRVRQFARSRGILDFVERR